ncbi:ABC transporter permease [Sodalis sp. RH21]|uniref:ABC transporter permease n=1 Tax=unclassified Sodalis (in: enterobacteria) TaxID=2636512 RepID=UPI0039B57D86
MSSLFPFPASRRKKTRLVPARPRSYYRLLGPLLILAVWQLTTTLGWVDAMTLPAPERIFATFRRLLEDGRLIPSLEVSAWRSAIALLSGSVLGVILALCAGLSRMGEALIDGPMQIKRAIPTLAMIPLFIIWLGIGEATKITIIMFSVLIPVYINTHAGLRGVDERYIELAETLKLSRWLFIRKVALPGAMPGFFTGLRLAVAHSWTSLVVVEQINATSGIGYLMTRARAYGQTDIIMVGLVIYALFGLVSDSLVREIERRVLSWRRALGN